MKNTDAIVVNFADPISTSMGGDSTDATEVIITGNPSEK